MFIGSTSELLEQIKPRTIIDAEAKEIEFEENMELVGMGGDLAGECAKCIRSLKHVTGPQEGSR